MPIPDVKVIKGASALGNQGQDESRVCGLLLQGIAISASSSAIGLALQTPVQLRSVADAEAYGITDAYDKANGILVYYHIREFFRLAPTGELWISLVAQSATWRSMVDKATEDTMAKKLLIGAGGRIRVLGVGFNPITGYTPILSGGLDDQMPLTINNAEALADDEFDKFRPVHVLLEGRQFNGTVSACTNLRGLEKPSVSVTIAQDATPSWQTALANSYNSNPHVRKHAAVGTMLGRIAASSISQNIGELATGDLTGTTTWLVPGLSSGSAVSSYTDTELNTLNDRGYVLAQKWTGYAGIYFNDDHTLGALTSDYGYIALNRVMNEVARTVRAATLPYLKANVPVSNNGRIERGYLENVKAAVNQQLQTQFVQPLQVSAIVVTIEPTQNIISTGKLQVRYAVTPNGTARTIENVVSFYNPFN